MSHTDKHKVEKATFRLDKLLELTIYCMYGELTSPLISTRAVFGLL